MTYIKSLNISKFSSDHNLVLAPLAGISDAPFRQMCRDYGADLTFTEMVSVDGLLYDNNNTYRLLNIHPGEHPIGIQLFGSDPKIFAKVIPKLEKFNPAVIDLNFGCPVRKVVNRGGGAALLTDLDSLGKIVNKSVTATNIPVTVKIRIGWDWQSIVAVEAAMAAEAEGAQAVTVHARTRSQGYSGTAHWEYIAKVKNAVKIPVIGNGDVFSGPDASDMFRTTGVDGIMLARGVLGRPWLFKQILHFLNKGDHLPDPPIQERLRVLERHYQLQIDNYEQTVALTRMKKHFAWYTKGLPHVAKLRDQIFRCRSYSEIKKQFKEYVESLSVSKNQAIIEY